MSGCGHGENGIPIGVDCIFCGTDKPEVCPGCINKHNDHIDLGEGFTHSAPSVKPGEVRNLYVDRIVALEAQVERLRKALETISHHEDCLCKPGLEVVTEALAELEKGS